MKKKHKQVLKERKSIITFLLVKGICPKRPHEMKMNELRELYVNAQSL